MKLVEVLAAGAVKRTPRRPLSLLALCLVSAAAIVALSAPSALAAATLKADYRFQDSLASSVAGAPDLQVVGTGTTAFANDAALSNQRVFTWPAGSGLKLPTVSSILTNGTDEYTIAMYFRLNDTSSFRKIIDYKNRSSDRGLYNLGGSLRFYDVTGAQGPTSPIANNTYVQVVVTRDADGTYVAYVNGIQQFSFTDSSAFGVVDVNDVLHFLIDDTIQNAEHSGGAVARLRVWDDALTATEVAALEGAPLAVTFRGMTASRTVRGVVVRWRTASEVDTLGFHVYRQLGQRRVRVNRRLIPSLGSIGSGSYSFLDRRAPRLSALRYWLQEVELDGSRTWHGPVRVRAT